MVEVEPDDGVFHYDDQEQKVAGQVWPGLGNSVGGVLKDIRAAKPWEKDPEYFTEVRISALALLKMVMHARSGGNLEIMGMLQGKVLPASPPSSCPPQGVAWRG